MNVGDSLWRAVLPVSHVELPTGGFMGRQFECRASYIQYEEWVVVRVTPRGGWIVPRWYYTESREFKDYSAGDSLRWSKEDGKFASATKEDAVSRLKARTRSYLKHCKRRLAEAECRHAALVDGTAVDLPGLNQLKRT